MDPYLVLIVFGLIILLGVFGEVFFSKTRISDAIWLIIFGIIISDGLKLVSTNDFSFIIPTFLAITVIVILFEGGIKLDLRNVIKYSFSGSLISVIHFIVVISFVTLLTYLLHLIGIFESWNIWTGIILGGILTEISSLVLMPMLSLAGLDDEKKNILSIENQH